MPKETIIIRIEILKGSAFMSNFIYKGLQAFLETMKSFTMKKNKKSKFTYHMENIKESQNEEEIL